jgi:hypothetical protein
LFRSFGDHILPLDLLRNYKISLAHSLHIINAIIWLIVSVWSKKSWILYFVAYLLLIYVLSIVFKVTLKRHFSVA